MTPVSTIRASGVWRCIDGTAVTLIQRRAEIDNDFQDRQDAHNLKKAQALLDHSTRTVKEGVLAPMLLPRKAYFKSLISGRIVLGLHTMGSQSSSTLIPSDLRENIHLSWC